MFKRAHAIKSTGKSCGKSIACPSFSGKSCERSTTRSGLADTTTGAGYSACAGSGANRWRIIDTRAEGFAYGKPRDLFRGNLYHGARFRIAASAWRTSAEPEAPKPAQFYFVPVAKRVDDAL